MHHVAIVQITENFDFGDFFADIMFDTLVVGCFAHNNTFYVVEQSDPSDYTDLTVY